MERRPMPERGPDRHVAEVVATDRNGRRLGDIKIAHISLMTVNENIPLAYDMLQLKFGKKDVYIFVGRSRSSRAPEHVLKVA